MPDAIAEPPAQTAAPAAVIPGNPPPENKDAYSEHFSELDQMGRDGTDKAAGKTPAVKMATPPVKGANPTPKDAPKPAEKPAAAAPEKPAAAAPPKDPKELREAYNRAQAKISELEKKQAELASLPKDDPEKKQIAERLAAAEARATKLEKERGELDEQVRLTSYERSKEYETKFRQPINGAWQRGMAAVKELPVLLEDGTTRIGTDADFVKIVQMGTADAIRVAKELFGDAAGEVLAHRRELHKLSNDASAAVEEHRNTWAAKEKEQQELSARQQREQQEQMNGTRTKLMQIFQHGEKHVKEKHPEWITPVEGDDEGNALLEKGKEFAAKVSLYGEKTGLTPERQAAHDSIAYHKLVAFDRMANIAKAKDARIAELEGIVKQYEESEPGHGRTRGADGKFVVDAEKTVDGAMSELDQLAKKR